MEQSTDFSGWSAIKRQAQGPGFWLKVQLAALVYLAGPTLVALAINRQFGMDYVWLLFIVMLVVDYFVITRYELWTALLAGSSVYSQLGGEEGFSKKDFWETVPKALKKVYGAIIITYKWRWFSLFALCVVQTRGNTFLAYPIIACAFVVIMASHRYVSEFEAEKARRQVYYVFSSTLFLTVTYGAIIGWFPEVRPYITAGSSAYRIEQDINAAYEQELQNDADRIGKKLKKMDPKLTFDQKVEKLTAEDRAAWERATRGWTREQAAAIRERGMPTLKMTLKEILPQGVQDWWNSPWFKRDAPAAAPAASAPSPTRAASAPAAAPAPAPATQTTSLWQGIYTPSQGVLSIGVLPRGSYRMVGSGIRRQNFIHQDGVHRQFAMDKDGRLVENGNSIWVMGEAKGTEASTPFPHQAYGALIVLMGSRKLWAADGQCFPANGQEEAKLSVNVPDHPDNRAGSGGLQLKVEPC